MHKCISWDILSPGRKWDILSDGTICRPKNASWTMVFLYICLRYSQKLPKIYPRYVRDTRKLCPRCGDSNWESGTFCRWDKMSPNLEKSVHFLSVALTKFLLFRIWPWKQKSGLAELQGDPIEDQSKENNTPLWSHPGSPNILSFDRITLSILNLPVRSFKCDKSLSRTSS